MSTPAPLSSICPRIVEKQAAGGMQPLSLRPDPLLRRQSYTSIAPYGLALRREACYAKPAARGLLRGACCARPLFSEHFHKPVLSLSKCSAQACRKVEARFDYDTQPPREREPARQEFRLPRSGSPLSGRWQPRRRQSLPLPLVSSSQSSRSYELQSVLASVPETRARVVAGAELR